MFVKVPVAVYWTTTTLNSFLLLDFLYALYHCCKRTLGLILKLFAAFTTFCKKKLTECACNLFKSYSWRGKSVKYKCKNKIEMMP